MVSHGGTQFFTNMTGLNPSIIPNNYHIKEVHCCKEPLLHNTLSPWRKNQSGWVTDNHVSDTLVGDHTNKFEFWNHILYV